jgi:serine O-acetyltransferase
MNRSSKPQRPSVEQLAEGVLASYASDARIRHVDGGVIPSRDRAIDLLHRVRELIFPGFFTPHELTSRNLRDHAVHLLAAIRETLERLIDDASHGNAEGGEKISPQEVTDAFLGRIPELRQMIAQDVQAAFDGDPAARHTDETIFCYPGVYAVFTHRIAHELYRLNVPLLPRLLSEYVHSQTGIDIHPGARIGHSFFIDHGTGVVIGETTDIGDRVKLYQGVTLGAMSFPRDEAGRLIRGTKRHPTLEDDVTIYANATVLGGTTVIGKGCIIGGSVFITKSVPPNHYVTMKSQELKFRSADAHNKIMMRKGEED